MDTSFIPPVQEMGSSSAKRNKGNLEEEDRISALPDPLIHHIFSFMDMKDIVQTSFLSSRWRYLWLSTTTLNFDISNWTCDSDYDSLDERSHRCDEDMCDSSMHDFIYFVEGVLKRKENSDIFKLNLYSGLGTDMDHLYKDWLDKILAKNVQQLGLRFPLSEPFNLPSRLFTSNIRELELLILGESIAQLPTSVCSATRLTNLDLENVLFPNGNSNGELTLSFPIMEHLSIGRCEITNLKVLTIHTPLLKSLKLGFLFCNKNMNNECKIKTDTPHLEVLKVTIDSHWKYWHGYHNVEYCLENISSQVSAYISLRTGKADMDHMTDSGKDCVDTFIKVLTKIRDVQVLKLSGFCVQVMTDSDIIESLPALFRNLRCLIFNDKSGGESVPARLALLERYPCLETLVWDRPQHGSWNPKDWTVKEQFLKMFACLKSFKMRNFHGSNGEQKFVEFVLERAPVLKEMVIAEAFQLWGPVEGHAAFYEKLVALPRASSCVSVSIKRVFDSRKYCLTS